MTFPKRCLRPRHGAQQIQKKERYCSHSLEITLPTSIQADVLSNRLISHLSNIEKTRRKSEDLFSQGRLVYRDLELIYAGLFLDSVTSFERYIEELFIGILTTRCRHESKKVKP